MSKLIASARVLALSFLLVAFSAACNDGGSSSSNGNGDDRDTSIDGGGEDTSGDTSANEDTGGSDSSEDTGGSDATEDTSGGSTLSDQYPGDDGIADDPAVLFFDDFEEGWGRWNAPDSDTDYMTMRSDGQLANSGDQFLESTVTVEDLEQDQYISSQARESFDQVDEMYWRFYARFPNVAPNPHHWVRVSAGIDSWNSSGLANTVPPGDEGFWFDFDINNDNVFNFYVYWHDMRSGRCNDGSAEPGCEGDQGTTYYYGNVFQPPNQDPYPRDEWVCIEMRAKANTPGEYDGELTYWIDDELVGDYRPGHPEGTWLRATFHTGGCDFSACTEPEPFEGFNFRTDDAVGFKRVVLDAYYERGSTADKIDELESRGLTVSDEQTIYYDDVVVATERIGCRR